MIVRHWPGRLDAITLRVYGKPFSIQSLTAPSAVRIHQHSALAPAMSKHMYIINEQPQGRRSSVRHYYHCKSASVNAAGWRSILTINRLRADEAHHPYVLMTTNTFSAGAGRGIVDKGKLLSTHIVVAHVCAPHYYTLRVLNHCDANIFLTIIDNFPSSSHIATFPCICVFSYGKDTLKT